MLFVIAVGLGAELAAYNSAKTELLGNTALETAIGGSAVHNPDGEIYYVLVHPQVGPGLFA